MKAFLAGVLACWACGAAAHDIVVIGEIHDNPHHHLFQAKKVATINPRAIVFEMLTPDQAMRVTPGVDRSEGELEALFGWNDSGWPDFSIYYPIFAAAPDAVILGAAVPASRDVVLQSEALAAMIDDAGKAFDLTTPLPEAQQTAREALQMAAHCNALPPEVLPKLVSFQRKRDAMLAHVAQVAFAEVGGPIVVITGNGHARRDWGVPALLAAKYPDISVKSIGQAEGSGGLDGGFDNVVSAPALERADPCLAFQ